MQGLHFKPLEFEGFGVGSEFYPVEFDGIESRLLNRSRTPRKPTLKVSCTSMVHFLWFAHEVGSIKVRSH